MNAAHTPGPWVFHARQVLEDGSVFPAYVTGGKTAMQVCLMESPAIAELLQNDPVWSRFPASSFDAANARLIAAAPELLEFAQEVRRTGDTRLASMAIAVIAKATGEQQ